MDAITIFGPTDVYTLSFQESTIPAIITLQVVALTSTLSINAGFSKEGN